MGRRRQPEIAEDILNACADYALAHGLPDRLEPLVHASNTSARMLLYHFGSRDELLKAVLRRARQRQLDAWGDLLRPRPDEQYPVTLARAWSVMSGPAGRPYRRMFGRLREDSEQRLWPGFRRNATTDWLEPLEQGLRDLNRPPSATLVLGVIRGLLLDLDATGDTERNDRAFEEFLALLAAGGPTTAAG